MRFRGLAGMALAGALVAGCDDDEGGGGNAGAGAPAPTELTVSAAASLTTAFEAYGPTTEAIEERFSFAGSDALAGQIRQGAEPDVYAAANTKLPEMLAEEGLVAEPVELTTNSLVLAVPVDSRIASIEDLTQPGVELVIGSREVPFGSYTRTVLERLPEPQREAILANVVSEEPDVNAAVGKLTQGAGDAGFTYRTDVAATNGRLKAIDLPADLQPDVAYGIAIVEGTPNREAAQAFIDGLLTGQGEQVLRDAGFTPVSG